MRVRGNLSETERWASALSGAMLAVLGIRRRSFSGAMLAATGGALIARGASGFCPAYESIGKQRPGGTDTRASLGGARGLLVDESVTVAKSSEELYAFWREFENLPRFMNHLVSVKQLDERRSHWVAKAPAGRTVAWDAEVIQQIPNELIGWRTLEGADVVSAGLVRFKATGREDETHVHVRLQYDPPAGKLGAAIAWMFGQEPSQAIREDLRRFKSLLEADEIPTTEGQPHGSQSILNYD